MGDAVHRDSLRLRGTTASAGIAWGKLHLGEEAISPSEPSRSDHEDNRLLEALDTSASQLMQLLDRLEDQSEAARMLEFQLAMIEDDSLRQPAIAGISQGSTAFDAWVAVLDAEIADYAAADDEYFQARVADLKDIRDRVCHTLAGTQETPIPENSVVVMDDMTPSRFLATTWGQGGIALTGGSATSHVAMLARAANVPMVINLESVPAPSPGDVFLDANTGELIIDVSIQEREALIARKRQDERQRQEQSAYVHATAVTSGGDRVLVQVNLADPRELDELDATSCDGVGLVRTEFLFHQARTLPGEDEQFEAYRRFIEWAQGQPVTVRTLDAGGDKPIAGVTLDNEQNPFLGVRGIRLSLLRPELFRVQLRALLRASAFGPLKIMLPMVTVPEEVAQARAILNAEREALTEQVVAMGEPPLGMMVEVPSAAIAIEQFDADFFSIGSNDLVQYVTACSRDADRLEQLAKPDNPAVLRLIEGVARYGAQSGREVSVCGEMAGDPNYIGLLLERGLRTLSVAPAALARTKYSVIRTP